MADEAHTLGETYEIDGIPYFWNGTEDVPLKHGASYKAADGTVMKYDEEAEEFKPSKAQAFGKAAWDATKTGAKATLGGITAGAKAALTQPPFAAAASGMRESANIQDTEAARLQDQANKEYARGNRNPNVAASQEAGAKAAAQAGQTIAQTSGAAGGGAAVIAGMNTVAPEIQEQREYQARQRKTGIDYANTAARARTNAADLRGAAGVQDEKAREKARNDREGRETTQGPEGQTPQQTPPTTPPGNTSEGADDYTPAPNYNPVDEERGFDQSIVAPIQGPAAEDFNLEMNPQRYQQLLNEKPAVAAILNSGGLFEADSPQLAELNSWLSQNRYQTVRTSGPRQFRGRISDVRLKNIIPAIHRRFL